MCVRVCSCFVRVHILPVYCNHPGDLSVGRIRAHCFAALSLSLSPLPPIPKVFARHFAQIREHRYLSKLKAAQALSNGENSPGGGAAAKPFQDAQAPNRPTFSSSVPEGSGGAGSSGGSPPSSPGASASAASPAQPNAGRKRAKADFVFLKTIGTGSYSKVWKAEERDTKRHFAIKVLEKAFIIKEKKEKYVHTEKDVFSLLFFSPYIIKMFYTFQDSAKLYFCLEFAEKGELLDWVKKLGSFDLKCTQFYAAEILMALDHMHSKGIIHRDLKPENILLDSKMHVKICDFGSAKDLSKSETGRADSFVGTAQYVSPELLNDKTEGKASDLSALGCIIYQLLSGDFPFRAGNEYQTFKKISALDYEIPAGFPPVGKSLVESLLVLNPDDRLGTNEAAEGLGALKAHPFWEGMPYEWETLHSSTPPELDAYLPAISPEEKALYRNTVIDMDIDDLLTQAYQQAPERRATMSTMSNNTERKKMLEEQEKSSPWHGFCRPGELIIKTSLVDKRRGLFSKRRQLVLTDTPRLFYIDTESFRLVGEIFPLVADDVMPQFKSQKSFWILTPDRTYYLDDVERSAVTWVDAIQQVQKVRRAADAAEAASQ